MSRVTLPPLRRICWRMFLGSVLSFRQLAKVRSLLLKALSSSLDVCGLPKVVFCPQGEAGLIGLLKQGRADLQPWKDSAAVRALDERLASCSVA